MQKQNRLRAEFASNPSAAEAEEKSVEGHEKFDREIFHNFYLALCKSLLIKIINSCAPTRASDAYLFTIEKSHNVPNDYGEPKSIRCGDAGLADKLT